MFQIPSSSYHASSPPDGPIHLRSKLERFQKRAKIHGVPLSAKNMQPVLGYRAQQWGVGVSGDKTSKKSRFNPHTGPGRT